MLTTFDPPLARALLSQTQFLTRLRLFLAAVSSNAVHPLLALQDTIDTICDRARDPKFCATFSLQLKVARSTSDIELSFSTLLFLDDGFEGFGSHEERSTAGNHVKFFPVHRSVVKYTSQPEAIIVENNTSFSVKFSARVFIAMSSEFTFGDNSDKSSICF